MGRSSVRSVLVLAAFTAAACASPPPPAPSAQQVAGAWIADSTMMAVSGGECIGADLQNAIGRRDVVLAALSGEATIDATITSQGNGTSCEYTGSNVNGRLSLTLTVCRSARLASVPCSAGGQRDLQLVGGTIQAQANSQLGTGSGTDVSTWNVMPAGSSTPIAVLSVTASFTWVFLGLPSSDYHNFTGTVFPGYADGTISIPADPNPWCLPCGWFH